MATLIQIELKGKAGLKLGAGREDKRQCFGGIRGRHLGTTGGSPRHQIQRLGSVLSAVSGIHWGSPASLSAFLPWVPSSLISSMITQAGPHPTCPSRPIGLGSLKMHPLWIMRD